MVASNSEFSDKVPHKARNCSKEVKRKVFPSIMVLTFSPSCQFNLLISKAGKEIMPSLEL